MALNRLALSLSVATMHARCTSTGRHVATGVALGGATGGTAARAVAGARAGLFLRNLRNGYCRYRDPATGQFYTPRC